MGSVQGSLVGKHDRAGRCGCLSRLLGSPRSSASMSYDTSACLSQRAARLAATLQAQRVISPTGCMQDAGPINLGVLWGEGIANETLLARHRKTVDMICTQQQYVKLPAAAIDSPTSRSISPASEDKKNRPILSVRKKNLCRRRPLITNKPVSALAVFEL